MRRFFQHKAHKAGMPPGSVVYVGEEPPEAARITVIDYGPEHYEEREVDDLSEVEDYRDTGSVTWINVDGVHEEEIVEEIGARYALHPLLMEDVVSTGQRPKMEEYEEHLFMVLQMLVPEDGGVVRGEQVSLVLGPHWIVSFQERRGDVFDGLRHRLRSGKSRARTSGPDYLAYRLLDAIVDQYFVVLERMGDSLEDLEEQVIEEPDQETLEAVHELKGELLFVRRAAWPVRELVNALQRAESELVAEGTDPYLRDVYDHAVQVIDTTETYRDLVSGLVDLYMSGVSNRMNEVMKVLTIIATIFIPVTFVAGLYGMNFQWMPELQWRWGYPAVLVLMAVMAGAMIVYFRRRDWL